MLVTCSSSIYSNNNDESINTFISNNIQNLEKYKDLDLCTLHTVLGNDCS